MDDKNKEERRRRKPNGVSFNETINLLSAILVSLDVVIKNINEKVEKDATVTATIHGISTAICTELKDVRETLCKAIKNITPNITDISNVSTQLTHAITNIKAVYGDVSNNTLDTTIGTISAQIQTLVNTVNNGLSVKIDTVSDDLEAQIEGAADALDALIMSAHNATGLKLEANKESVELKLTELCLKVNALSDKFDKNIMFLQTQLIKLFKLALGAIIIIALLGMGVKIAEMSGLFKALF